MEGTVPKHAPHLGSCLQFTGSIKHSGGYGQFYYQGRNRSAHVAAWEMEHGPVPAGMQLDHLCRNTSCVRTSHMEVVTPAENTRRAAAARLSCSKGHVYAETGVYRQSNGRRTCRQCVLDRERAKARGARGLPDRRRRYPAETVESATRRVLLGEGVTAVANDLGMSPKYLYNLKRRARATITS